MLDGTVHVIDGGALWLDRQMIARSESSAPETSPAPTGAGALKQYLATRAPKPRPLYVGDWMSVVLGDGHALALAVFWQKSTPQWITGTLTGRPPRNGFGNLYYPVDAARPTMNGGLRLRPRTAMCDERWDFDLNLLTPEDPARSPHWRSPITGKTYATAWQIALSDDLATRGLPKTLYVFALSDNCEIVGVGKAGAFFEGAARVYADPDRQRFLGHAFVEQMGFD